MQTRRSLLASGASALVLSVGASAMTPMQRTVVLSGKRGATWTVGKVFLAANGQTTGWAWTVDTPSPPSVFTGLALNVQRHGFDGSANATMFNEAIPIVGRLRLPTTYPYPGDSVVTNNLSPNTCYLAEAVCSSDVMLDAGATNNSPEASPLAIANWASEDRQLVGNSILAQVTAGHYFGIACVVFTATDGTNSITPVVVSAQSVLTNPLATDANPIVGYQATLDVTGLNDSATITVNAKVYPKVGTSTSVLDSSAAYSNAYGVVITGSTTVRNFGPQTYYKKTAWVTSPIYAAVSTAGNDSTGVISQTLATALATPFLTPAGAMNSMRASTVGGKSTSNMDGCRIEMMAGTSYTFASQTSYTSTSVAGCVIEAAPGESSATVTITSTTTAPVVYEKYLRFRNVTFIRGGSGYAVNMNGGGTAARLYFDNCVLNNSVQGTPFVQVGQVYINGGSVAAGGSGGGTMLQATANAKFSLVRGVSITPPSNNVMQIDSYNAIGNACLGYCGFSNGVNSADNTTWGFTTSMKCTGTSLQIGVPTVGVNVTGFLIMQSVFEYISATTNPVLRLSADGETTNLNHVVKIHCTAAGLDTLGRDNMFYDEAAGTTRRTHKWIRDAYNIPVSTNTKIDRFVASNQSNSDAIYRIGCGWHAFGVGVKGNLYRYRNASSGDIKFGPENFGLGGNIPTTNTSPGLDPLFVNYQGPTGTDGPHGVAGVGGGDYHVQAGSPANGMCDSPYLAYDLSGVVRRTDGTEACGAYARP